jgi:hypothetical protein
MANRPTKVGNYNVPGVRVLNDEQRKRTGGHLRSKNERGYTSRWDRVSKQLKQKHPLCEVCFYLGMELPRPSIEVHHIVPIAKGGEVVPHESGLVCVCKQHHELLERLSNLGFTNKLLLFEEVARRERLKMGDV